MQYFENCATVNEVKWHYKRLCMKHHPDRGGNTETMQEINRQYQEALVRCDKQVDDDGYTYYYNDEIERVIMTVIDDLLKLKADDLKIDLIGRWVWVTGNTRPYKDELRRIGLRWNPKRQAWFWRIVGRWTGQSKKDLKGLAEKYGCRTFDTGFKGGIIKL